MKLGRVPWGPSVHPEALVHIHPHAGFSVVCDRQRTRCPSGLGPEGSGRRSGVCSGVGSPQTLASHGRFCNPRSRAADGPELGQQDTAADPQTPIPGTSPELGGQHPGEQSYRGSACGVGARPLSSPSLPSPSWLLRHLQAFRPKPRF